MLVVALCQESVDDLSEISISDKTKPVADLLKYAPGNKSSGSFINSSESDTMSKAVGSKAVGSTDPFSTARTNSLETVGIRGMTNGQSLREHMSVGSLWPDMAAIQLSGNDMKAYPGSQTSLYMPLMVSYVDC